MTPHGFTSDGVLSHGIPHPISPAITVLVVASSRLLSGLWDHHMVSVSRVPFSGASDHNQASVQATVKVVPYSRFRITSSVSGDPLGSSMSTIISQGAYGSRRISRVSACGSRGASATNVPIGDGGRHASVLIITPTRTPHHSTSATVSGGGDNVSHGSATDRDRMTTVVHGSSMGPEHGGVLIRTTIPGRSNEIRKIVYHGITLQ